jgi:hypothetical protein
MLQQPGFSYKLSLLLNPDQLALMIAFASASDLKPSNSRFTVVRKVFG